MGAVRVTVRLSNASDMALARRNLMRPNSAHPDQPVLQVK